MNQPAARIGIYLLLSVLAVAAVAGGLVLSRRDEAVAAFEDPEHAIWGASAG